MIRSWTVKGPYRLLSLDFRSAGRCCCRLHSSRRLLITEQHPCLFLPVPHMPELPCIMTVSISPTRLSKMLIMCCVWANASWGCWCTFKMEPLQMSSRLSLNFSKIVSSPGIASSPQFVLPSGCTPLRVVYILAWLSPSRAAEDGGKEGEGRLVGCEWLDPHRQ